MDLSGLEDAGALRRLSLLFKSNKGGWALGVFSRASDRTQLIAALGQNVAPHPLIEISFQDHDPDPLRCLREIPVASGAPPVVCFTGILFAIPELALHLDLEREDLARMPHRLVFWVSESERVWMLEHAPNFCSRASTFYFRRKKNDPRQATGGVLLPLLLRGDDDLLPRHRPQPSVTPAAAAARAEQERRRMESVASPAERADGFLELAGLLELAPPGEGQLQAVVRMYQEAATQARIAGLPTLEGEAWWRAGSISRFEPSLAASSRPCFEHAAETFRRALALGDPEPLRAELGLAASFVGLASCDLLEGRLREAVQRLEESARTYQRWSRLAAHAVVLKILGGVAVLLQDEPAAESALQDSYRVFERLARKDQQAAVLQLLGDLYARQGRAEAEVLLQQSLTLAIETRDLLTEGYTRLSLGHWHLGHGEHLEAETSFLEALSVLRRLGFEPAIASALISLSGVLALNERPEEAIGARAEAEAIFHRWGLDRLVAASADVNASP